VDEAGDVDLGRSTFHTDRGIDGQLDREKDHHQRAGHDGYATPPTRLEDEHERPEEHREEDTVLAEQDRGEKMDEERTQ
jgi:hypothetical protein